MSAEISSIGARLREERQRLGLSQPAFAALGGAGKHSQINYEANRRSPDAAFLAALAAHGVDILYVVTGKRIGAAVPVAVPVETPFIVRDDLARTHRWLRAQCPPAPYRPTTWRDMPRICLPGYVIRRAVEASTSPLSRVGPAICQRLELLIERLDDSRAPAWFAAPLRSTALWLTQSPNSEPQAIPEETSAPGSSPATPDPSPASGRGSSASSGRA